MIRRALERKLGAIIKLLVAGGLIYWLIRSGKITVQDLEQVGQGWPWFVLALVPFGLVLGICAQRWRLLLRAQDISYSARDALALTFVGHFFNQFLIGTTGGDMVKAYAVAMEQPPGKKSAGVLSVFLDRVVGLLVLVFVALAAILFNLETIRNQPRLVLLAYVLGAISLASIAGGYAFYSERFRAWGPMRWLIARLPWKRKIAKAAEAVYVYKFHKRTVAKAVLLSVGVHVLIVLMHLCLARALFAGEIPWVSFFFLIPLGQIAMAIPINPPAAIGTGEWIYSYLLPLVGVQQGAAICLLQRFVAYAWALVGCAAYLRRKAKVSKAAEAAREAEEHEDAADPNRPRGVGALETATHGGGDVWSRAGSGAGDA